jgi:hypothetical protein
MRAICPAHIIRLDFLTLIVSDVGRDHETPHCAFLSILSLSLSLNSEYSSQYPFL